jgi:hypothetical protein
MTTIFERSLDNLIGRKACVIEAFLRHVDKLGAGFLSDLETTLNQIDDATWNDNGGAIAIDAITFLDATTLTILREFAADFHTFSSKVSRAVLFALLELAMSEFTPVQPYWLNKFRFTALIEVKHA